MSAKLEVRTVNGDFDEVVASGADVHMEVMSTAGRLRKKNEYAHVWMRVTVGDKCVVVNLYSDTAITVTTEEDSNA